MKIPNSNIAFHQDDTINLFTYAILRLTPRAMSSGSASWSYLRKGSSGPHATTEPIARTTTSITENRNNHDSLPTGDHRHIIRPLQHDKWFKGKDGFLVNGIWQADAGSLISSTPVIFLQHTEEKMYLCAYQYRNLTLILLIPASSAIEGEQSVSVVKQLVLENVSLLLYLNSQHQHLLTIKIYELVN